MDSEIYTQIHLFTFKQHYNTIHGLRLILMVATISSAPDDMADFGPRDQKLCTEEYRIWTQEKKFQTQTVMILGMGSYFSHLQRLKFRTNIKVSF